MHGRVEWVTQEVLDECEWKLAGPVPSSHPEMAVDWLPSIGSTSEGTWVTAKVRNKSWHALIHDHSSGGIKYLIFLSIVQKTISIHVAFLKDLHRRPHDHVIALLCKECSYHR